MKNLLAMAAAAAALLLGTGAPAPAADARDDHGPVGTTITFVNNVDDEPHTVTATDKKLDSDGMDAHQAWKHAFAKAGP